MRDRLRNTTIMLLGLQAFVLVLGAYFVLRPAAHWTEGDTQAFSEIISSLLVSGRLVPEGGGESYVHGMAYPAISAFAEQITGIPVQALLAHVYPFTVAMVVLVVFVAYRQLTGSTRTGLLATLLLFLLPDFLWVSFRGSHEKVTWSLVLLALFLLVKGFAARDRLSAFMKYVFLFYLVSFALIATNVFFGSSFVAALSLGLLQGSILLFLLRNRKQFSGSWGSNASRRLLYVTVSCSIFVYLFIFFIYPPALSGFGTLVTLGDKVSGLVLNLEPAFNPYEYVPATWINSGVYLALTLFNWVVLFLSAIVWIVGIRRFLRVDLGRDSMPSSVLIWLIYSAFAIQLALAVLVDRTKLVGGNLQVRLFTPLMLVAIPLVAMGILYVWPRVRNGVFRGAAVGLAIVLVAWFGPAALMKATNEPALSNQWTFYTDAEQEAGTWTTSHIDSGLVWVQERRLNTALKFLNDEDTVPFDAASIDPGTRYYLLSEVGSTWDSRLQRERPNTVDNNRVYDNGGVYLYHLRPLTPYQR